MMILPRVHTENIGRRRREGKAGPVENECKHAVSHSLGLLASGDVLNIYVPDISLAKR